MDLAAVDAELDELQAELAEAEGPMRSRAGWSSVLAAHLRFLTQAIEQAWAAEPGEPFWAAWRAVRGASGQAQAALARLDRATPPTAEPATSRDLLDHARRQGWQHTSYQINRGPVQHDWTRGKTTVTVYDGILTISRPGQRLWQVPLLSLGQVLAVLRAAGLHAEPSPEVRLRTLAETRGGIVPAEPTDDQLAHWAEHNHHTEGADRG